MIKKFSVITATYNNHDTFMECIDSLYAQSESDFEHIIIDSNNDIVSTQNSAFYFGISPNITFSKVVHTDIAKKICHVEGGEE